jgi:LPXTG-motif cell wall-anchored protein
VVLKPSGPAPVVLAALAEGEDAPRPQQGFLAPPQGADSRSWIAWAALGLVLAVAFLLYVRRRRTRRAPVVLPGPLERLARLERDFAEAPDRAREVVFELTHIVRERVDAARGQVRDALPDDEWLRAIESDPHAPPAAREPARLLLEAAAEVKYAFATPTRFAVEEQIARARAVLKAFDLPQELAA